MGLMNDPAPYHHGNLRPALIDAAVAILTESQQWDFSLREVSRRAGVSHNAPYSHFNSKRHLLADVAVEGCAALRERMLAATENSADAADALTKIGLAYAQFAEGNPAYHRLIFGPLFAGGDDDHSRRVVAAVAAGTAVLDDTIRRGAREGIFAIAPQDEASLAAATLAAWSLVHGLTTLFIDGLVADQPQQPLAALLGQVSRQFRSGLAPGISSKD